MNLLQYVPGVRYLEAAAFAVVVTAVGGVYVKQRLEVATAHRALAKAETDLGTERAAHARDLALAKTVADAATIANQSETIRRTDAQREIDDESQRLETRARDAAVRASTADAGLRDAFAARTAPAGGRAASGDSAPVAVSASSAPADVVRADVFGRVDGVAGDLALALDVARTRGLACEREHDSLTK